VLAGLPRLYGLHAAATRLYGAAAGTSPDFGSAPPPPTPSVLCCVTVFSLAAVQGVTYQVRRT